MPTWLGPISSIPNCLIQMLFSYRGCLCRSNHCMHCCSRCMVSLLLLKLSFSQVLLSYPQFSVTPHKLSVYKRLSQCLLPGLPGGVHTKVLEVYITTFKRIGFKGVLADLPLISFGLFPLMSHASMQVRSLLLELYDGYLLPLGKELVPALEGIMLAVLPAVEEDKEQNLSSRYNCVTALVRVCLFLNRCVFPCRVITFLDNLLEVTEARAFESAFWSILGRCFNYRLQCLLYWHARKDNRICVGDDVSSTVSCTSYVYKQSTWDDHIFLLHVQFTMGRSCKQKLRIAISCCIYISFVPELICSDDWNTLCLHLHTSNVKLQFDDMNRGSFTNHFL